MHSQEPWQSRSPTDNVNKPSISSTLRKTGRKGSHHSYGRGLPVKRKALVILTVAILAFAMVPAIGAGAAVGTVKIVTPDELANPTGKTGSAFEKLDAADYVSDKTGMQTSLEDAGGTLFVVVDDNDEDSNSLTDYYAYFTATRPGTADGGGNAYNIDPGFTTASTANGIVASWVTDSGDSVAYTDLVARTDDTATSDVDESDGADPLEIGDRNRSGSVDHGDLLIEVGYFVAPVADDPGTADTNEAVSLQFEALRTVNVQNAFVDASRNGKEAFLSLNIIPAFPADVGTRDGALTGEVGALRIRFASAGVNELTYDEDSPTDLVGKSRVQVRSSSGDPIRVTVREKDLGVLDDQTAGVNHAALTAEDSEGNSLTDSRDSGVFVGMFGVIRNDFKEAIATWTPTPTETVYANGDDDEENNAASITVVDAGAATPPGQTEVVSAPNARLTAASTADDAYETTLTIGGFNKDNILKEGSVSVAIRTNRDTSDPDVDGVNPPDSPPALLVAIAADGISAPDDDGNITIKVRTTVNSAYTATTVSDGSTAVTSDVFSVSYTVDHPNDNISDLIAAIAATDESADRDNAFYEFCQGTTEGKECAERDKLDAALKAHAANLGLSTANNATGSEASALVNSLVGAEHGDTLTVSYADASPSSTRTDTAEVDLNAPTIGSLNPADNSYIDNDDFSVFFNVTDPDSGIPEDADDAGEQTISGDKAYVEEEVTLGVGDDDPVSNLANGDEWDLDVDETVQDGERYELEIDVTQAVQAAEGDEDTDAQTVTVRVKITAYDIARNVNTKTYHFIVDNLDPVLEKAITGWGISNSATALRANGDEGAYVLVEQQRNRVVLVFDDAIDGDAVQEQDITVSGTSVSSIQWLDQTGGNVISVGDAGMSETADDLDFNAKTRTSDDAADVVRDMALRTETDGQDARHLLFLTLEADLATDARPSIEIDGGDLSDLAGNQSNRDHERRPDDRLAPIFTISVEEALSNDTFNLTVDASEELKRRPDASISNGTVLRTISLKAGTGNTWTLSTDRKGLNLVAREGMQDGVYEVTVEGTDEIGNEAMKTDGKWELDTRANKGALPNRSAMAADDGTKAKADVAQKIETNEVIFLNLDFSAEGDEYTGDTKKKINIDSLALETLAGDAINATTNKIVASPTVESTLDVDAGSAQTSDGVKHVIALSGVAIGSYRLNVNFSDEAGNTSKFGYVFKVTAPAPEEIAVVPGWSLVSIPGTPQDSSIGGVFEGSSVTHVWSLNSQVNPKVWEYAQKDADSGEWMGTLTQIVDGRAYFVRSTTFDPIEVLTTRFDPQRLPSQYTVTTGWNGVGYTPAGNENAISVDGYLSSLGASGWGMIRMWNASATPPQYETYFSSGAMTDGFPTGDGMDAGATGGDADNVDKDVAKVERGKGYLLFATRNGQIGGA